MLWLTLIVGALIFTVFWNGSFCTQSQDPSVFSSKFSFGILMMEKPPDIETKCLQPSIWLFAHSEQPLNLETADEPDPYADIQNVFKRFSRSPQLDTAPRCNCLEDFKLRDLGRMYYPRHLPEAVCNQSLCNNQTFTCVKIPYTVKVLRERYSSEIRDDHLPTALRDKWLFDDKEIIVNCECVRQQDAKKLLSKFH